MSQSNKKDKKCELDEILKKYSKYDIQYDKDKSNCDLFLNKYFCYLNNKNIEINSNNREKEMAKYSYSIKELVKHYKSKNYKNLSFVVETKDKFLISSGDSAISNSTILFHHTYDVPFIPGQAIKGVIRNYIIKEYFEENEERALKDYVFKYIFGNEENKGNFIFLEAYPDEFHCITNQITRAKHFNEFEKDNKLSDYNKVIPIKGKYLKDTIFSINIIRKSNKFNDRKNTDLKFLKNNKDISEVKFKELILEAFEINGVGSNTSNGYGILVEKKSKEQGSAVEKEKKHDKKKTVKMDDLIKLQKKFNQNYNS